MPSAGTDVVEPSHPESLSASRRRRMLDVSNALHLSGVQVDIDLPVIAAIGCQSVGKSSLIEDISGVTLPRASGTSTRCPMECRLSKSSEPWQCIVSLHIFTGRNGRPLGTPRNEQFGETIYNKEEVLDRILCAQRAILTPDTDYSAFLGPQSDTMPLRTLAFSMNTISLQISGPDVQDLSFCDLPGLIASVGSTGNEDDIALVRELVTRYIQKPSCIILLTVTCETDFQNQGAHRLARTFDPEGARTIGVLTKPDRIPSGEEGAWLRLVRNQDEPLHHGWFSVRQPDSLAIQAGITREQARESERQFFSTTAPWSMLDLEYKNRLGTEKIAERLGDVLSECMSQRLPSIQEELQKQLTITDEETMKLPKAPLSDSVEEVLSHISTFSKLLGRYLEGTPSADGLLQSVRPARIAFRKAIRATEPDFRPYARQLAENHPEMHRFVPASFLTNEGPIVEPENDSRAIYIDDVLNRAQEAITRELTIVIREYITSIVSEWKAPAEGLFRQYHAVLTKHVRQLASQHFAHCPQLQTRVATITTAFVRAKSEDTIKRCQWFMDLELMPHTLNEPYYTDFRDRFLSHYKAWRSQNDTYPDSSFLAKLNLHGAKPADLANLLPPDPLDKAIDIMASVRAYFQVAYKRFTDYIPMAIDHELVLSLDRNQALEKALRKGIGIGGPNAPAHCNELMREPTYIAHRREELSKKRERLEMAQQQLSEVWLEVSG